MKTPDMIKFLLGLKLKKYRFEKGLSLQALSKVSGLSSSYLNEIEKGKKYPKVDKLLLLAKGLKIKMEDLSGPKVDKTWRPLTDFLESDFYKNFPLETFGMNRGDLYDLMSHNPQKFSSLIATFVGLARHYEMEPLEFSKLAFRSYQESKDNHFPGIEKEADEWRSKLFKDGKTPEVDFLISFLKKNYRYEVLILADNDLPCWPESGVVYIPKKRPKLIFHESLDAPHRLFYLAKELGFCVLGLKREDPFDLSFDRGSFLDRKNELKAFYFACALLWPKDVYSLELKSLFGKKAFCEKSLLSILSKGPFLPEIFIQRMAQIIPQSFGLKNLFYLRMEMPSQSEEEHFKLTDELHLSKLHFPHESRLNQHYCRRWASLSSLKEWISEGKGVKPKTSYYGHLKVQKSRSVDSDQVYFCVSLASQKMWGGKFKGSPYTVTLGLGIDNSLKKNVSFWKDSSVEEKVVGQTCETCSLRDCSDRVVPSQLNDKKRKREKERDGLKDFCQQHF